MRAAEPGNGRQIRRPRYAPARTNTSCFGIRSRGAEEANTSSKKSTKVFRGRFPDGCVTDGAMKIGCASRRSVRQYTQR